MADLAQITSPSGVKFTVAKEAADAFSGFLADLEGAGYKIDQKTSGGYNDRNIAGTNTPSLHSFGRAIDINPGSNARGEKTTSDLPKNVAELAAAHGLTWGGNWSGNTRDPMHFELAGKTAAADVGPSADDLLRRMDRLAPAAGAGGGATTGAASAPGQDQGPSGDDLLRRMEGIAATPAPAAAATEEQYRPPAKERLQRILGAAKEAWEGTNLLTPEARAAAAGENPNAPPVLGPWIGKNITNPLATVEDYLFFKPLAAAGGAATQWAYELGTGLGGPSGGRDAATLLQVLPAGEMSRVRMPGEPPMPRAVEDVTKTDTRPVAVPPRDNALSVAGVKTVDPSLLSEDRSTGETSPTGLQPPTRATAPPAPDAPWVISTKNDIDDLVRENAEAGGPSNLSAAATPPADAAMSPKLAKAYRRMAEVNQVVSPIEGRDFSIKVPGSIPTEAEGMGDPVISQKEVLTRQRMPEAFEGENGRLTQNDRARVRLYDDETLSDPQIETLKERKAKQATTDTDAALKDAKPVEGAPVAAQIDELMANPRIRKQSDIMATLSRIRKLLFDDKGNPETAPQAWWGVHDELSTMMDKAKDPMRANKVEKYSFNQIRDAKEAVDAALNTATNGRFQIFKDNQAQFAQQLNAATLMRDFRAKMVSSKTGMIYPDRFHRFVTDLAIRRGKPGVDPAMDIPDEKMQALMAINDDLKRAGRIDLGKPRGSPTNLYFELAKGLGIVGAHSAIAAMGGGPIANLGLQSGINWLERSVAGVRLHSLVDRALNPSQAPETNLLDRPPNQP